MNPVDNNNKLKIATLCHPEAVELDYTLAMFMSREYIVPEMEYLSQN